MSAILKLPPVLEVLPSNSTTPPDHTGSPTASTQMEALKTLEMGYRLFPDEPAMLSAYGACLARCGQPEPALPFLEKAAQLETNNVKHLVNLARARIDANQLVPARATLEKAALLAPDDVDVLQVELKCYWLQQEFSSAREVLLKLNKLAPNPENAYWLSEVEKKLAQPNK
jgi:tetratricopeptide (TPR) repeat protein